MNKPDKVPRGALLGNPRFAPDVRLFAPPTDLERVVAHFWFVDWEVPRGQTFDQWILPRPTVNIGLQFTEQTVSGVQTRASCRRLHGRGWVRGIQFRSAGFAALTGPVQRRFRDRTFPVGDVVEPAPFFTCLDGMDDAMIRAGLADWIRDRVVPHDGEARAFCERAVQTAEADPTLTTVSTWCERLGVGERTLQRRLADWVGLTPKMILRRFRLHEAAHRLTRDPEVSLADVAFGLGYADQAHFTRDFRRVLGRSPGRYIREVRGPVSGEVAWRDSGRRSADGHAALTEEP